MDTQKLVTLVTEEEIKAAIVKAAADFAKLYENEQLTIVADLSSSFIFIADLIRELPIDVTIQFVTTPIHEEKDKRVKIDLGLKTTLKDKNVLIVNDILFNGNSLSRLYNLVKEEEPKDIKILTLIEKNSKTREFSEDYTTLFKIDDNFVVGYGLTYKESYRGLKGIYSLVIKED
ncbi:phosphoribosyltransferase [Spiroplasma taiwanense]|uniref:Hypoxanthine-guanine phosphoribosyltransferase n=1 Tax=Spiroplasma taiwanense CT-1 TaxID=1276220 RepID=S5MD84_9MOLU|nr:phosphoribosyltransferase family protein [Spiroplasma taiwanense]AGR41668.1 hypoxanthine-guanine phosphoribosyltransferase [Spiroplasma taiwanense CT-1]